VQHHLVALEGDGAQHLVFQGIGIAQQGQGLVAVGRHDDGVEAVLAGHMLHGDTRLVAADALHRAGQPQFDPPARLHGFDVARRAPDHGAPLRPIIDLQHAMVVHEADEVLGREVENALRWRGPQRRSHRDQVGVAEQGRVALCRQVVTQRRTGAGVLQQRAGFAVEAQDLAHHPQKRRRQQVAALAEQAVEAGRVVFEAARFDLHAEAHGGVARGNAEFIEQGCEQRVVVRVVDDEPGVHPVTLARLHHLVGVGVATEPGFRLEQHHLVPVLQAPGGGKSGNTTADDSDPHA